MAKLALLTLHGDDDLAHLGVFPNPDAAKLFLFGDAEQRGLPEPRWDRGDLIWRCGDNSYYAINEVPNYLPEQP